MSTLSGIDQALWDIKGKKLGVPVYELLGGMFRDRIPAYANSWFSGALKPEEFAAMAEVRYVSVSPHNPSGPVACTATLQLAAYLPSFTVLEFMAVDVPFRHQFTNESLVMEDCAGDRIKDRKFLEIPLPEDRVQALQREPDEHSPP